MSSNSTSNGFMGIMSSFVNGKPPYQRTDAGKPERHHRTSERYIPAPEPPHGPRLYGENKERLYNIWLVSAEKAKQAVGMYAESLQGLLGARNEHEMTQKVVHAGEILKASVESIISAQTNNASSFITTLPLSQQNAAIEYWGALCSQLRDYSEASMKACGESIKHLADMTVKLWAVNRRLVEDIDRVYDRTVSNVR